MRCKDIGLVLSLSIIAGCQTVDPVSQSPDPGFGEVTRHNAALQIINPDPFDAPGSAQPGELGDKGQAALERYRTDQVNDRHQKEVGAARNSTLSTTEGTQSGGGGPK